MNQINMYTYYIHMSQFSSIQEMPRYQATNPFNYDKLTLGTRKREVNEAMKDYPNVPPSMIEMAWDLIHNNPQETIDDIISTGKWEKAARKERPNGGVLQSVLIE